MRLTYSGKFKNLKQQTALTGVAGEWRRRQNNYQYHAVTGALLNWRRSTGTITFQGPNQQLRICRKRLSAYWILIFEAKGIGRLRRT
jgi:hypothetical protein